MIKLIETFTPTIGEPNVRTKEFPTRNAFKKALRMAPLKTEVTYGLLKHGKYTEKYQDGVVTMEVIEDPKLEIVK